MASGLSNNAPYVVPSYQTFTLALSDICLDSTVFWPANSGEYAVAQGQGNIIMRE